MRYKPIERETFPSCISFSIRNEYPYFIRSRTNCNLRKLRISIMNNRPDFEILQK